MLTKISENVFEVMGTVVGVLASLSIATQIYAESLARTLSTLSIDFWDEWQKIDNKDTISDAIEALRKQSR